MTGNILINYPKNGVNKGMEGEGWEREEARLGMQAVISAT